MNNEMKYDTHRKIFSFNASNWSILQIDMKFDWSYYEASRPGSNIHQLREPRAISFHFVNKSCNGTDIKSRLLYKSNIFL